MLHRGIELHVRCPLPSGVSEGRLIRVIHWLWPKASVSKVHWMNRSGGRKKYYYRISFSGRLIWNTDQLAALVVQLPKCKFTIHNSDL